MCYQISSQMRGYRVGYYGKYQRRHYIYVDSGSLEFTDDQSKATIFTSEEVIDVFVRLMGTMKRDYFINEAYIPVYSSVQLEKQDP